MFLVAQRDGLKMRGSDKPPLLPEAEAQADDILLL